MNWFRFYHAALDDPKVQRLDPCLFKAWVNLLCLASEGDERGWLPSTEDIGFRLRTTTEEAERIVGALVAQRLIDVVDDRLAMHNWSNRQPVSDDVNARVTKHRQAKKQDVTLQETLLKQKCNTPDKNREDKSREERPPSPPSGKATYADVLNGALPSLLTMLQQIDKQFTDGWLKTMLVAAESEVGPLPRDRLGKGLDLAVDQIKRQVETGTVRNPRMFARKVIVDYLMEQRNDRPRS